jgi:hypothetical protein
MSAQTGADAKPEQKEEKAAFSLDASEQELLEEFGVLSFFEYTYGA